MSNKTPNRYSEKELKKVGVEIINKDSVRLKCTKCNATWSPNLQEGGRLPKGYWKCPNGCN